jgi:cell pole-organizing protein PopZ
MAEAAKTADQSMEEILQSIKRIIAEEGDTAPSGSDVLELTEVAPPEEAPTLAVEKLLDSLAAKEVEEAPTVASAADIEAMFATPAAPAEPVIEAASEPVPAMVEAAPMPEAPVAAAMPAAVGGLIEDTTAHASAAALKQLLVASEPTHHYTPTSGVFRSGTTVEDLVVEALRPMLKEWLDAHLPEVVERLVQREIQKIVATLR